MLELAVSWKRSNYNMYSIGLLSWNTNDCLVDLEKELMLISEQSLEGEAARCAKDKTACDITAATKERSDKTARDKRPLQKNSAAVMKEKKTSPALVWLG
ncbi:hypothetical protein NQ315_002486 [Exocentrus adspersus]|uniref:Uncharacterized protein n=1 Tax=Exocentrus adspersus TaxID=1586481 RepID=A0AAV8VLY7_9CUCU|nr:hypothetical protein NQ315_002486 [Exocentrus adspersus]